MQEIDQRDRELLSALQSEVPLVSTPFAVIGQVIEMSEKEVIKRTDRLRADGWIRQISALLDGRLLGYRTALVAAIVPEDHIEEAAAVISAHPGVSQNYRRNHDFNLWFTLSTGPDSRLGIERTATLLGEEAGCSEVRLLPTLKLLKGSAEEIASESESIDGLRTLTSAEIAMIRLVQQDLPATTRPFDALARSAEVDPEELMRVSRELHSARQLKKFCAFVQPKKANFTATAMGVWEVPESQVERFAEVVNSQKAVTHCYLRPTHSDWPYNVFTTLHGRSVDECEATLLEIARETGIGEHRALYPTREFKRSRVAYFAPELESWESPRVKDSAAAAS